MKTEIEKYRPCEDAIEYRKQFKTFKEAWEACPRGDWMLWLAAKLKIDNRLLTLAKGRCAETVKHLMTDERSVRAVEAAIAYGKNEISAEELRVAADADAYAADAYAAYAADAYAADAPDAAAYAAAAREENRKRTADICRELLTDAVFEVLIPDTV